MPRTATIWFLTVFAYALFYAWYTGFAGPLSAEEIEIYLTRIAEAGDADADRLAHPGAHRVDQARNLLQAGARRCDQADVAAPHRVGEAERHAIDDRGAAIGAHHHQPARARQFLERDFVGEIDVVAEHHHVESEVQRLPRLRRRIVSRSRDQRQRGE